MSEDSFPRQRKPRKDLLSRIIFERIQEQLRELHRARIAGLAELLEATGDECARMRFELSRAEAELKRLKGQP